MDKRFPGLRVDHYYLLTGSRLLFFPLGVMGSEYPTHMKVCTLVRNLPPPQNMNLGACIIVSLLWMGNKFHIPNESKVPLKREGEDPELL